MLEYPEKTDISSQYVEKVCMRKLIRNRAQCLDCMDIIESIGRHHFTTCKCYSDETKTGIFIDGGQCYQRSGAYDFSKFKDLSEYEEDGMESL